MGVRFIAVLAVVILAVALLASSVRAQDLGWRPFEEALAVADTSGRPVLVDVWAPWCGWCHRMKRETYPALASQLKAHFVLTRLNRDDNETTHRYRGQRLTSARLAQALGAEGVPAVVLLSPDGEYQLHVSGFFEAKQLRPVLEYAADGSSRSAGSTRNNTP